jgi:general stress protein YciG
MSEQVKKNSLGQMLRVRLTVEEMARRGGLQTLSKYGKDHFRRIGRKGGQRTKELYQDRFKEWGMSGGRPSKQSLKECMEGEKAKK